MTRRGGNGAGLGIPRAKQGTTHPDPAKTERCRGAQSFPVLGASPVQKESSALC